MLPGLTGDRRATQRWIRWRVRVYARRAGLAFVPAVSFGPLVDNQAEYLHAVRTISVDLAQQLCRHDADDSVAHEIVHARWPSEPHGARFQRRISALRRGLRCGPHGARLPEDFR